MKKYFSVGEAAKATHMTSETLRHYDRIGLIKPSKKAQETNYRYYSEQDLVRLNTVRALQQMDLPLQDIKQVLGYNDLEKIIDFLSEAEKKADDKIASLQFSKAKIQSAKKDYEKKLHEQRKTDDTFIQSFPRRVILLSDTMQAPTVDNLWNYLSHFYDTIDPAIKDRFAFEDLAGIYSENGLSRLFAVCVRYIETGGLKVLPEGKYLCANCTEENRARIMDGVMRTAKRKYHIEPTFSIQKIVVTGILQWNYQIQILIEESGEPTPCGNDLSAH